MLKKFRTCLIVVMSALILIAIKFWVRLNKLSGMHFSIMLLVAIIIVTTCAFSVRLWL